MKEKKVPMRMCIGCKGMFPKKDLLRIVIPKDGDIDTDDTGRAHGRGAYICKNTKCLQKAQKQRTLRLSQDLIEKIKLEMLDEG